MFIKHKEVNQNQNQNQDQEKIEVQKDVLTENLQEEFLIEDVIVQKEYKEEQEEKITNK